MRGPDRGLALEGQRELLDVLLAHPGHEVQALDAVRADPGDHQHRGDAFGVPGAGGQRVRATAGPAGGEAARGVEVVEHGRDVVGDVGHRPAGGTVGVAVAGPRVRHQPQAAGVRGAGDRAERHDRARRAVVEDQRDAVVRPADLDVEAAPVGQLDARHVADRRDLRPLSNDPRRVDDGQTTPCPTIVLGVPVTDVLEQPTDTARATVEGWLQRFDEALTAGDAAAAAELFGEDSYWRDLIAFTWNIKTVEGRGGIAAMLDATLRARSAERLARRRGRGAGRGRRRDRGVDRVRDRGRAGAGASCGSGDGTRPRRGRC